MWITRNEARIDLRADLRNKVLPDLSEIQSDEVESAPPTAGDILCCVTRSEEAKTLARKHIQFPFRANGENGLDQIEIGKDRRGKFMAILVSRSRMARNPPVPTRPYRPCSRKLQVP